MSMKASQVQKGDAAVLFLASQMAEVGLVVLRPLCEALPFDLALWHCDRFYRIQVKHAQHVYGDRYLLSLRKLTLKAKGRSVYRYTKEHTDFVVGVVMDKMCSYVFPIEDITHIAAGITLDPDGVAKSCFKMTKKIDTEKYRNKIILGSEIVAFGKLGRDGDVRSHYVWPPSEELMNNVLTHGLHVTASMIGCSPATVRWRLKRDGYQVSTMFVNGRVPER